MEGEAVADMRKKIDTRKMSFSDWKKRSKRYQKMMTCRCIQFSDAEEVTQAAYKAGERHGRKDVEEIAKNAIELRESLRYNGTELRG